MNTCTTKKCRGQWRIQ